MTDDMAEPKLEGCMVLPPLHDNRVDEDEPHQHRAPKPRHSNTRNRFMVLNSFVDDAASELGRSELLVWLVLYRDTRDGAVTTSQSEIAKRAGICDRTVRRALGHLQRRGLLQVIRRGGPNKGASKYRVLSVSQAES
jgi:DNA-binding MarR family transcriptional regulator